MQGVYLVSFGLNVSCTGGRKCSSFVVRSFSYGPYLGGLLILWVQLGD